MIFFSIIAAASAAVVPLDQASEVDLRCVAVFANALSATTDDKQIAAYSASLLYFLGKIDGRQTGFDLGAQLYRLISLAEFRTKMDSELNRCKGEVGNRSTAMITAGQQLEQASK